jgi:vacuolar-type H+-ATPase subunit F/Vma7
MSNIAFVGPKDLHGLFRSVGIDCLDVAEGESAERLLHTLVREGCQVIYIVESLAKAVIDTIEALMKESAVSIVIMRDSRSSLGIGMELDRRAAIDAVGTDAVFSAGTRK